MVMLSIYRSSTLNVIDDGAYIYLDLQTEPLYKKLFNIGDEYDPDRTWWKNSQNRFRQFTETEYLEVLGNTITFHSKFGTETVLIENNTIPFWENYYGITRGWLGGINLDAGLNTISLSKADTSYRQEKLQRVKNHIESYQQKRRLEVTEHQKQIANIDLSAPFDGIEQTLTINNMNYSIDIPVSLADYSFGSSSREEIKIAGLESDLVDKQHLLSNRGFNPPENITFDIILIQNKVNLTPIIPEGFTIYQDDNSAIFFDSTHNLFSVYSIYDEQTNLSIIAIALIIDDNIDTAIQMYKSTKTLRKSS